MTNQSSVSQAAADNSEIFRGVEELFRCERVFILQPQRVVLDEQYRRLRTESRNLAELLASNADRNEQSDVADIQVRQLRLIEDFRAGIEAAGKVQDYTNYRSNQ